MNDLTYELQQRLSAELNANETIIWTGQPHPDRFAKEAKKIWFIAVPLTVIAVFQKGFHSLLSISTLSDAFNFLLDPLLLFALGMLIIPLFSGRAARLMVYAITSQRVIIIDRNTTRSYLPREIIDIARTEQSDGSGDLKLGEKRTAKGDMTSWGFYGIPNVKEAEGLIKNLIHSQSASA